MNGSQSYRPVIVACGMQFVSFFSFSFSMAFLTLFIYGELGARSLSEAGMWSGTALLLACSSLAVMSPVWGWLTTKIGGRRMLVRVMLGNALVVGLMSVTTSVYQVLALRLIEGAITGTGTIVMTIIASSVDENRLPQMIGYQQSIATTGSLMGPAVGAAVVPTLGFRYSFLTSCILILAAIPFVFWARFEEKHRPTEPLRMVSLSNIRRIRIGRNFIGLISVQAAFAFITPILPVYLNEAGITGDSLIQYTGLILSISGLAYALSVPVTTRLFRRKSIPLLLLGASGAVLAQAFFRQVFAFTFLRIAQCFLHSAAPSSILGEGAARQPNKGLAMGLLNSASTIGMAVGPFVASTITYAVNLTVAFAVTASVSIMAAVTMISRSPKDSRVSE